MFAKNLRCWFWPDRLNIMPGELQKKRRKFWEKKKSVHTKKKPKFLRPTSIFLCTKLRSCFLKMTTHKDKSRSATLCLTGALKKRHFPPSPQLKKNLGRKNLPNLLYFWPQFTLLFWKIVSFIHIVIKKINRSIFFVSLFFHTSFFASYFIINFYEGKNHPSSGKNYYVGTPL